MLMLSIDIWLFLQQVWNGLTIGGIYALIALGITMFFALSGIMNFAHGQFLIIGALIAVSVQGWGGGILAAAAVASCTLFMGGVVLERGVFRLAEGRPLIGFVASLGLIGVLQGAALKIWGPGTRHLNSPITGVTVIGGLRIGNQQILVLVVCATLVIGLLLLLNRTRFGKAMRAVAEDRDTAVLMGISVGRITAVSFGLASALAAIGGTLIGMLIVLTPDGGSLFVVKGFAAAIIGGLGSVQGAIVGALILGITEALGAGYGLPQWTNAYSLAFMMLIILFRPSGLFKGMATRERMT